MPPPCRWPTAAPLALLLVTLAPVVHSLYPSGDAHSLVQVHGPTPRGPPTSHEYNEAYLRRQVRIQPHQAVNLWALPDCPPRVKPPATYEILAKLAIHGIFTEKRNARDENGRPRYPNYQGCTFQEICDAITKRYPYYNASDTDSWKGSLRHMLTLKNAFRHEGPPHGGVWRIDFSLGDGNSRPRKRGSKSSSEYESDSDSE
ncbi:hypothetical protein EV121DRAFT_197470 [Schizophyllum commune]